MRTKNRAFASVAIVIRHPPRSRSTLSRNTHDTSKQGRHQPAPPRLRFRCEEASYCSGVPLAEPQVAAPLL